MPDKQDNSGGADQRLSLWKKILFDFAAIATVLIVPLACSRFIARFHLLELASHFQWQYFMATCACLLFFLIVKKRRWAAAASIGVIVSGLAVLPSWTGGRRVPSDISSLTAIRVLEANVFTPNKDHDSLINQIRTTDPDIIVLQEVDDRWAEKLKVLQADWPFTISEPRGDNFGIVVFSRIKFDVATIIPTGAAEIPSIDMTVTMDGKPIRFFITHTLPPLSSRGYELRNNHITAVVAHLAEYQGSLVVLGDLNMTMWSPCYADLTESLELRNARDGFGILPTWPAIFPKFMRIPIDHCLVRGEIEVADCSLGVDFGSDHLPLIVDLAIHP